MSNFLGVDIGTTNIKSILFNENWEAVFSIEKPVETVHPSIDRCEQNPVELVQLTNEILCQSLLKAKKKGINIDAIGLSCAMHSFLPVDKDLNPLTDLMIWSDTRAMEVSDSLKKNSTIKKHLEKSNVPMHPMLPLAKWLWFNQYSNKKKQLYKVLTFKDFLIAKWFGEILTDQSTASATGCYHLEKEDWNHNLLQYLKLDASQLPKIVPTTHVLDKWLDATKTDINISDIPPLVVGSTDGCLANMAAGILDNTKASLTIGTSGAVRTAYNQPINLAQKLFCYPVLKDYYVVGGAVNNGGNAIEWFKSNLSNQKGDYWDNLKRSVSNISSGSDGLYFLPYLFGERAPVWDPSIKGSYIGVSHSHTNLHFLKASLEGVAYGLKHIFELIDSRPNTVRSLIVDGGFTKSEAWIQLVCDVIGVETFCPKITHGAAKGAAMLAKIATEKTLLETIIALKKIEGKIYRPNPKNADAYDLFFQNYLNLSSMFIDD